jgi:cytochrome c biogenesis protein CcmG, thiol:disulfide interchange protein DsbE
LKHRLIWIALGFVGCAAARAPAPHSATLPAVELTRVDGHGESLKEALGGSVAVIDLWATWCTACEQERPKLERLHAAYASQGLRVIGLDVGETPNVVAAYLAENRVSYPIYLDPDFQLADALGEKRLPAILVVDRAGRIVHRSATLDAETLAIIKLELGSVP